ncbi:hypothetical protein BGZ65_004316, partial [Modicella reniformis]
LFIHDYCIRRKFLQSANAFEMEAQLGPDPKAPVDEAPEGFLYQWFVMWWDCWLASHPQLGTSSKDTATLME